MHPARSLGQSCWVSIMWNLLQSLEAVTLPYIWNVLFDIYVNRSHRNHISNIQEPIQYGTQSPRFVWPCCYCKLKYIHIKVKCIYIHIRTNRHCYFCSATLVILFHICLLTVWATSIHRKYSLRQSRHVHHSVCLLVSVHRCLNFHNNPKVKTRKGFIQEAKVTVWLYIGKNLGCRNAGVTIQYLAIL